jgi:hypothetical protein
LIYSYLKIDAIDNYNSSALDRKAWVDEIIKED